MTKRIVGIGDLHCDGKLVQYVPTLNRVIGAEVDTVLRKARKRGVTTAALYGDLCERSRLTDEAYEVLFQLFLGNPDFEFIVLRGNHDVGDSLDAKRCSLTALAALAKLGALPNVRFVLEAPQVLFDDTDYPINVLPWPFTDTRADMLNMLHAAPIGGSWETGRAIDHGFRTKHLCVTGHIHKAQKIRNTYVSGTLYQTSFGDESEKGYHVIDMTGDPKTTTVNQVAHSPALRLHNVVLSSLDDYRALQAAAARDPSDVITLRKVFIQARSLTLPPDAFADLPSVVKIQGFQNKADLQTLLQEDLSLDDASDAARWDMMTTLRDWLQNSDASDARKRSAYRKARSLAGLLPTKPTDQHDEPDDGS